MNFDTIYIGSDYNKEKEKGKSDYVGGKKKKKKGGNWRLSGQRGGSDQNNVHSSLFIINFVNYFRLHKGQSIHVTYYSIYNFS